ncbi:MAG: hypothetical protein QOE28_317 [Solirubrobacteraceae bacterium]|nr:hypothetical protein [Solirubrobacteraceae bacterium]
MIAVRSLEAIRAAVGEAGADALWIHPSVDLTYLTGLAPAAIERPTALVVLAGGGLRALAPDMLAPELGEIEGADVAAWSDGDGPEAATARVLGGVRRLLVSPWLPAGHAFALRDAGAELALDPGILARLRERKQPHELEQLRAAGREADDAADWIGALDLTGWTERRLTLELTVRFLRRGVTPYAGYIAASGANGALPHHETGDTEIDPAAPLLVDFGCVVGGYHSDITRVYLPRGGEGRAGVTAGSGAATGSGAAIGSGAAGGSAGAAAEAAEALEIVRAAHDAVIAGLEPGMPAGEADRLARAVIEDAGYGERFIHRTGHGVGLEIHEEPYLRPGNPKPLEAGHVFSVEPGIYVPGRFGVRYENLVHLGPDGPELLNKPS